MIVRIFVKQRKEKFSYGSINQNENLQPIQVANEFR